MKEKSKLLTSLFVLLLFSLIAGGSIITGEPAELWFWIGGFVLIVIIFTYIKINQANQRSEVIKQLKQVSDFNADIEFTYNDAQYWVGINNQNEEIKILKLESNGTNKTEVYLKFANIISVELLEDGMVKYSKSAMRTFGGAVLGGVLAGGAGAIIGGLSGDSKEEKQISKIEVKLLLRDYRNTSFIMEFYSGVDVNTSSLVYKMAHNEAMDFVDTIKVIIDKVDRKEQISTNTVQRVDVSKDIEQLYDLKVKGIISEEEFQNLKKRYLYDNK